MSTPLSSLGAATLKADVVIAGGGLAGLVTALGCLEAGQRVVVLDRDTPERLGGLALWAFGGMALVGTPLQARMKIPDTPERAWQDWLRFGELGAGEHWPRLWAQHYVQHSRTQVHDWLVNRFGLRFMPAVNWVERGDLGEGNSLPRYHVLWGTARELVRRLIAAVQAAGAGGRLQLLSRQRVVAVTQAGGQVAGVEAVHEDSGAALRVDAPVVVLAMGGINGSAEQARAHWPAGRPMPASFLNGADPLSDGRLHAHVAATLAAPLTHVGEMWNYAAGIPHPRPRFEGHGLSLIPCKSALWLDHRSQRIGPAPLVTGFDTHGLCQRVAAQPRPYTWQVLNWRIAKKELAVSGAEHNPSIRDQQRWRFAAELFFGNERLVRELQRDCPQFLVDDSLAGLAQRMNALTGTADVDPGVLQATVQAFDANFVRGPCLHNDDQLRRIVHARQWLPDRLRTCAPAPLQQRGAGPYIAIQLQLVTRKSLGGLQTDLHSRVLDARGQPISGLYSVGEAAGFGGGGSHGKRSLEGTFLPSCILTARAAVASITGITPTQETSP